MGYSYTQILKSFSFHICSSFTYTFGRVRIYLSIRLYSFVLYVQPWHGMGQGICIDHSSTRGRSIAIGRTSCSITVFFVRNSLRIYFVSRQILSSESLNRCTMHQCSHYHTGTDNQNLNYLNRDCRSLVGLVAGTLSRPDQLAQVGLLAYWPSFTSTPRTVS